ncbi:hypothetical protein AB5J62_37690 [Amycolatopsis sp. cg5]|uniref:nSTAND1 domain-containing NTPase n=1 Tax=Amycolatopsis sp. cg5 TaxID=3238802 RepID=UPI0035260564
MPRRERPLEPGDDAVVRFAASLRELRERAGGPTYRDLSKRAGYSAAALSDAAGGRKLPGLALTTAYVTACGGDLEHWEARWRAIAAELAASEEAVPAVPAETETPVPYLGLAAFQPDDAKRFFGRERLVKELIGRLREHRFVGVFGASGSGKSSLLRAGLTGAVEHTALVVTPGARPLEQCEAGLAGRGGLLIVDQFEEVFTLCHDEAERTAFIDALLALAADEHGTTVVIGVRADFYGHCGRHTGLVDALRDAQVLVGAMTGEELRAVIVEPAVLVGCRVETALVTRLVADAAGQPAALPLVSHALLETWRRRQGVTLTVAGYEAAGGIHDAIAHTAESVYKGLDQAGRELARQIFLRLTTLDEGMADTKRRIGRRELDSAHADVVLDRLADARLLTLDRDGVEIAHEALIRCWPRLREWLDEDREGLRVHRQLTEATDTWEALGRDHSVLYRGTRLSAARDWSGKEQTLLTSRERDFLDASLEAQAAETETGRRRTKRLRGLVALLAVLLLVAGITTVLAVRSDQTATGERNLALGRKVVAQLETLRTTNPALAVQLSLAAYRLAPAQETRDALLSTFGAPYATRLTGHTGVVWALAYSADGKRLASTGRDDGVRLWDMTGRPTELGLVAPPGVRATTVGISQDGATIAIGDSDDRVHLWDVADPRRPAPLATFDLPVRGFEVSSIAFSGHTHLLAVGSWGNAVRLWDVLDPKRPRELTTVTAHTDGVSSLAFSGDGTRLVTASIDHTVRLWDLTNPAAPAPEAVISDPDTRFRAVAFSPDGRTVATGGLDQEPRLWDVTDRSKAVELAKLPAQPTPVYAVAFSPDGRTLAAAGPATATTLWDVTEPRRPKQTTTFGGHLDDVHGLAFSPDGRTLATGSADKTIRLEEVGGPASAMHADQAISLAYRPDGKVLATAGADRTLRLWDTADPRARPRLLAAIPAHRDRIWSVRFTPDGAMAATSSDDFTTRLWDLRDPAAPKPLGTISAPGRPIYPSAFGPDGRTLYTSTIDGELKVWDLADPAAPALIGQVKNHTAQIAATVFDPAGTVMATAGFDATVRLWDVTDRSMPRQLAVSTESGPLLAAAFSPDGHTLATAGADGKTRLWDVTGRALRPRATLGGHLSSANAVAFSPDGRLLATGSADKTVRLWNITDATGFAVLSGHTDAVAALAFAPDGHTLASTGFDRTIRLWDTSTDAVAARICALAWPRLTRQEWDAYFPGVDFREPCP